MQLTLESVRLNTTCHYDPGLGNRASKDLAPITVTRRDGQLQQKHGNTKKRGWVFFLVNVSS